ncbi:hypothetical protein [Glutamicibacter creatinolyticus]|uniref:hypothetical protein n=1 Tax=Glutamicibacter creatinolyticus TaxID=162496 RepID=UPI00321681FC
MSIKINDNGAVVNYRITVPNSEGNLLVTEGTATDVCIDSPWYSPASIKLDGVTYSQSEEVLPKAEEPVAEEPEGPVQPELKKVWDTLKEGENPYLDGRAYFGQCFGLEDGGDYSLEHSVGDEVVRLCIENDDADSVAVTLTRDEALKMATRLASITPSGIRTFNGASRIEAEEEDGLGRREKTLGSVLYQLHSLIVNRENDEALAAYERELAKFEEDQAAKKASEAEVSAKAEDDALDALAYHATVERYTVYKGRSLNDVKDWLDVSFPANRRRIQEALKQLGMSAVERADNRGIEYPVK